VPSGLYASGAATGNFSLSAAEKFFGERSIMGFKVEEIERLIEVVKRHGIQQLEVEEGGIRVNIVTQAPTWPTGVAASIGAPAPTALGLGYPFNPGPQMGAVASLSPVPHMRESTSALGGQATSGAGERSSNLAAPSGRVIKSPFVGTFYRAPSPGADTFVEVGKRVKKGETLCIVEAMKLMNEIESEFDGVIKEILVENEQAVEFDQPLFIVE
jgi:acetyl-CoA carboxylase biotin carboxyl carrier protein